MAVPPLKTGALVISLDFELAWGMFDHLNVDNGYRSNLLGAREVVPRLLETFHVRGIGATWATVGILFADGSDEALYFAPALRPGYEDDGLDPYRVLEGQHAFLVGGSSERTAPLWFAPSLVRAIADTPRQELASHSYSHFLAMEPGVTRDAFSEDLMAAQRIARHVVGTELISLVHPRHQVRADFLSAVSEAGFKCYRGPEPHALARPHAGATGALWERAGRMLDSYIPITGANVFDWPQADSRGLVDVRESRFLRPASHTFGFAEPIRVNRIIAAMRVAARTGRICHIWWHPHNFGANIDTNLRNLFLILDAYDELRDEFGFTSLTMSEVANSIST